ncbi:MAG TPA: YbjN domain-containing protein [Acidimicrobiales bacterium]|nr:YbjN domain-containing protein [Acidimicrobiales bacterium]
MHVEGDLGEPADRATLERVAALVDKWATDEHRDNAAVLGIETELDNGVHRWLLRLAGEEKQFIAVWFALRQRSLSVETYFMPAPEENVEACFTYLMRLNARLGNMRFAIGQEDAVFLMGAISVHHVNVSELDRLLGSAYAYTEAYFRPAMRIGFATRFPA